MQTGLRNLITDIPGLKVGNAEDHRIKTGTTVLTADKPFTASVHVMGGAPGTRETDLLAPDKLVPSVDALFLSGGSGFGLDAGTGIMQALRDAGRGFPVGDQKVPIVPGAILFDLINGGQKDWATSPYPALGQQAFANASSDFALGSVGAGTGALTMMHKGGLGSASAILEDGTVVGALVGVNAIGSATAPETRNFWAAPFEVDDEFGGLGPATATNQGDIPASPRSAAIHAATTLAIVGTSAPLTKAQCQRLAVAAHDGMARAIVPSHTPYDGDLVFALSTGDPSTPVTDDALLTIGHAASICLARAIARGVYHATPEPDDILPCWSQHS